jgi:hypothetical protein
MNKYKVKISHLFSEIVSVEAENEEEAKQKAKALVQDEKYNAQPHYETTIPPEHWVAITEEKFNEMVEKLKEELQNKQEEPSNIITP